MICSAKAALRLVIDPFRIGTNEESACDEDEMASGFVMVGLEKSGFKQSAKLLGSK